MTDANVDAVVADVEMLKTQMSAFLAMYQAAETQLASGIDQGDEDKIAGAHASLSQINAQLSAITGIGTGASGASGSTGASDTTGATPVPGATDVGVSNDSQGSPGATGQTA